MSKISELSDGGALQSTDYLIAVRSGGNVKVQANGAVSGTTGQFSTSLNVDGTVTADGLTVDTNTLHVDATNNRVGVNTTSPSQAFHVVGNTLIPLARSYHCYTTDYGIGTPDSFGLQIFTSSSDSIRFGHRVSGTFTEDARLDASGNLLVGKASSAFGTAGLEMRADDRYWATATSARCADFNRLSTDGDIVAFYKDSTTVGSIGTSSGDLTIGTNDVSLRFSDGANAIFAVNSSGASRDAATDLGFSSIRFKDLYLSGGVYLGGTGAANLLDDYEEGTWTPVVADAITGGNVSATTGVGNYTKVGRMVTVTCAFANINTSGMTAGNPVFVRGLPFATADIVGATSYYIGASLIISATTTGAPSAYATDNGNTTVNFNDGTTINISDLTSGAADIYFTLTYETT